MKNILSNTSMGKSSKISKVLGTTGYVLPIGIVLIIAGGGYAIWSQQSGAAFIPTSACDVFRGDTCTDNTYPVNNAVGVLPNTYEQSGGQPNNANALNQALAQPMSLVSYNFLPDRANGTRVTGISVANFGKEALANDAVVELRTFTKGKNPETGTLLASSDPAAGVDLITIPDSTTTAPSSPSPSGSPTKGPVSGLTLTTATLAKPIDMADGSYSILVVPKPYQSIPIVSYTSVVKGRISGEYLTIDGWKGLQRTLELNLITAPLAIADFFPNNSYTLSEKTVAQVNKVENTLVTTSGSASSPVYNQVAAEYSFGGTTNINALTIMLADGVKKDNLPNQLQAKVYVSFTANGAPDAGKLLEGAVLPLSKATNIPDNEAVYTFPSDKTFYALSKDTTVNKKPYYYIVLTTIGSQEGSALVMKAAPSIISSDIPFMFKDSTDEKTFTWMTNTAFKSPIIINFTAPK